MRNVRGNPVDARCTAILLALVFDRCFFIVKRCLQELKEKRQINIIKKKENGNMQLLAPAKINLALDVISRRPDGYHQVDMIMQSVELADLLTLEPAAAIELSCNRDNLPTDGRNLVWRAARLLQEVTGITRGVKITLEKRIPVAAGLGGGSADAAAALIGLNELWGLGLSQAELLQIGVRLGADVPFCIMKGTARARGIGEELTPINSRLNCRVLLVTPDIPVSTASVYQKLRLDKISRRPRIDSIVAALKDGDLHRLFKSWGNVLEEVVLRENALVRSVKSYFKRFGLEDCLMSGSGPSVFTLDPPREIVEPFLKELPANWFGCLTRFQNE